MFITPPLAHESQESPYIQALARSSLVPTERIPTVKDQFRHSLGIANGVSNGQRASLRDSQKCVRAQTQSINNSVQILLKRLEGDVGDVPVGKSIAPAVVANEAKAISEEMVQICSKRV